MPHSLETAKHRLFREIFQVWHTQGMNSFNLLTHIPPGVSKLRKKRAFSFSINVSNSPPHFSIYKSLNCQRSKQKWKCDIWMFHRGISLALTDVKDTTLFPQEGELIPLEKSISNNHKKNFVLCLKLACDCITFLGSNIIFFSNFF